MTSEELDALMAKDSEMATNHMYEEMYSHHRVGNDARNVALNILHDAASGLKIDVENDKPRTTEVKLQVVRELIGAADAHEKASRDTINTTLKRTVVEASTDMAGSVTEFLASVGSEMSSDKNLQEAAAGEISKAAEHLEILEGELLQEES